MAKNKKGGDYEGWILRLIEKPEDLVDALDDASWQAFFKKRIRDEYGYDATEAQQRVAADYREVAINDLAKTIGVDVNLFESLSGNIKYRFRDTAGKWGRKGTWVSPAKITGILEGTIKGLGVRKKEL